MTNLGTIYLEVIGSCVSFVDQMVVRPTEIDVEGSARLIVAYMWNQWLAFLRHVSWPIFLRTDLKSEQGKGAEKCYDNRAR